MDDLLKLAMRAPPCFYINNACITPQGHADHMLATLESLHIAHTTNAHGLLYEGKVRHKNSIATIIAPHLNDPWHLSQVTM